MATIALGILGSFAIDKLYDHFFPTKQTGKGSKRSGAQDGGATSKLSRTAKVQAVAKKLDKMPKAKQIALIKSKT